MSNTPLRFIILNKNTLGAKIEVLFNVEQIERIKDRFIYFLRFGEINFWESFRDKDINYFY